MVERYNRLTFVKFTEPKIRANGAKRRMALFRCDCGDESVKAYDSIKCGGIKSCFNCSKIIRVESRATHGLCKHPLYAKYRDMINRCENPKVDRYNVYGKRGIKVCNEWRRDFKVFYEWCIANNWTKELSIDRIDVNSDYSPSNCRLITMREQHFNKQNTFYLDIDGQQISATKLLFFNKKEHLYHKLRYQSIKKYDVKAFMKKHDLLMPPC